MKKEWKQKLQVLIIVEQQQQQQQKKWWIKFPVPGCGD